MQNALSLARMSQSSRPTFIKLFICRPNQFNREVTRWSMTVLVTGATGFIGSWVVKLLLERGLHVRAAARSLDKAEFLNNMDKGKGGILDIVKMDLLDLNEVKNAVHGCEQIIHCAAALPVGSKNDQTDILDPSIQGCKNLVIAMDKSGKVKNLIHTSSVAAIRDPRKGNGAMHTRDDWCTGASLEKNPYGFAKSEAEIIIRNWVDSNPEPKPRLITIHPSVVFGPILHPSHNEGSMAYIKHFVKGPKFVIKSSLEFVDVRDVALAHVNALELGDNGQRYILHAHRMWMGEIGELLQKERPEKKWARKVIPRPIAFIFAIFHPKLTVHQLRRIWGKWTDFDCEDMEEKLQIKLRTKEETILKSIESLET